MNLSAVILAGGESRRMGQDKAWLQLGGQSLLARTLSTIRASDIKEIFISGRAGTDYSALDCPVLFDLEVGCGPLAGIERALQATSAPLLLVLAVDLPNMTAAFLRKLACRCDLLTGVVPKINGQLEPLAAIYPNRCRFIALDCLLKCQWTVRDFAGACLHEHAIRTFRVPRAYVRCFENWNSPADIRSRSGES